MKTIVVDKNGGGHFRTVQEAVNAAPDNSAERTVLFIKDGEYFEKINIPREKSNLSFIGESRDGTVLVYDDSAGRLGPDGQKMGVYKSPSTYIYAEDFYAENLTFANSASRVEPAGQAAALHVEGDRALFRNVAIRGHQDTLYTPGTGRQYYDQCYIEGTVDFIFGSATAVFDRCEIHSIDRHNGYVTAASTGEDQPYGYVFLNCRLTTAAPPETVYLGRPWRPYGSVIYVNTWMDRHIRPVGWDNWRDPDRERTARYAEFGSTGPGAPAESRAAWSRQLTGDEAAALTLQTILSGSDGWNPTTVKVTAQRMGG